MVFNEALAYCQEQYRADNKKPNSKELSKRLTDLKKTTGIDLGITDFATLSSGEKVKSPQPLKKQLKRLRKLQLHLRQTV